MDEQMSGMVYTNGLGHPDVNLNLSSITQAWALFLACLSLSFLPHKMGVTMATHEVVMRMKERNVPRVPGHH